MSYAKVLRDTNFDAWESVQSALDALPETPPEHARWLVQHLRDTKLSYWQHINRALTRPPPPETTLEAFMLWEVAEAGTLSETDFTQRLSYSSRTMTVEDLLSLDVRHSAWHAGQLMALSKSSFAP